MRIVSLLPSATEMICALGLHDQLVGISHECDFPGTVAGLPAVTKTRIDHHASSREIDAQVREELNSKQALYSLHDDLLAQLEPELIVTQSLCDVCAVAETDVTTAARALASQPAVFNMQPLNLTDVLDTVSALGAAAGAVATAASLRSDLEHRMDVVRARSAAIAETDRPRVAFLEWLDPPFNAGHWNPELIEIAGGIPLLGVAGEPSTTVSWSDVEASSPDVIIVGCCGFDLERTLVEINVLSGNPIWSTLCCVQEGRVYLVDGNAYFNRPGPRLVDSLELLAHTLHPAIHPLPGGLRPAIALDALASSRP